MNSVRGFVLAQFSQFYMNLGDGSTVYELLKVHELFEPGLGLVKQYEGDRIRFTSARQGGQVDVQLEVHESEPAVLDEWTDLVEFSVTAGEATEVESWDDTDGKFAAPAVLEGVTYRVRYVVINGQAGSEQIQTEVPTPPLERYILQFWPCAAEPPKIIRCLSPWARYWEHLD